MPDFQYLLRVLLAAGQKKGGRYLSQQLSKYVLAGVEAARGLSACEAEYLYGGEGKIEILNI